MTRGVQEFRDAALRQGISWWWVGACSMCNVPIGYVIRAGVRDGREVAFSSDCGCVSDGTLDPRTWDDVADHYNLQRDPQVIAEYDRFWGFEPHAVLRAEPGTGVQPEFTPDQIMEGIASALRERRLDVIPGLLKLLAVQDPDRAQSVLDAFDVASGLRGRL